MDDSTTSNRLTPSPSQHSGNIRHLQTDKRSVRLIPYLLEFTAERLKAQMLGGQAETIALRGFYLR